MKYISKTLLTLSSILICQIVFADCPNQIKEDAIAHTCTVISGQAKRIEAGLDTFQLAGAHSVGSTYADFAHSKGQDWIYKNLPPPLNIIPAVWTSADQYIPLNVPFAQLPGSSNTNAYRPAQIIASFTFFGLIQTYTSQNNIGDVYALQIWGINPEGQKVLLGEKRISATSDMFCNSLSGPLQVCATKAELPNSDQLLTFEAGWLLKTGNALLGQLDYGPFDYNKQHIGYAKFLIETYTTTPMTNISAAIVPLQATPGKLPEVDVYNIELNINT